MQAASVEDPTAVVQATMVVNPSVKPLDVTTGPMSAMRGYSVTALQDGRVLIAGGCPLNQDNAPVDQHGNVNTAYTAQAWIYDPDTQAFSPTGSLLTPRGFHQATLLNDGKVLITGGSAQWLDPWSPFANDPVQSGKAWARYYPYAELFDPATGTFTALPASQPHPGPLNRAPYTTALQGPGMMWSNHSWGSALKMTNGKVLVTGGDYRGWWSSLLPLMGMQIEGADLYDPAAGTFDLSPGAPWRFNLGFQSFGAGTTPRMESLADGRVLLTYGHLTNEGNGTTPASGQPILPVNRPVLIDPATMQTTPTGPMVLSRFGHTLTRLPDGRILAVGGKDYTQAQYRTGEYAWNFKTTATAEIYDPATNTWTATGSLTTDRAFHAAILLPTGQVQILGGYKSDLNGNVVYPNTTELYDPDTGTFSIADHLDYGLTEPQLALLNDGGLFMAGQLQAPMESPVNPQSIPRNLDSERFRAAGSVSNSAVLTLNAATFGIKKAPTVSIQINSLIFNSDHGVLINHDQDFDGTIGVAFTPRGWVSKSKNNPITHTFGQKIHADITLIVQPKGIKFDLIGTGDSIYFNFHKANLRATGIPQTISIETDLALPAQVNIHNEMIHWNIRPSIGNASYGNISTGPHRVFATFGPPIVNSYNVPTVKRMEYACRIAAGSTTITTMAESF